MNRHRANWSAMGDNRAAAEIFTGIENRAQESTAIAESLRAALDIALTSRKCASHQDRVSLIKGVCIDWLMEHDIEMRRGRIDEAETH